MYSKSRLTQEQDFWLFLFKSRLKKDILDKKSN
jgi:hypothetical protein